MRDRSARRPLQVIAFSAVDLSLPQGHALHLRRILEALHARGHAVRLVTPRPAAARTPTRFVAVEIPILRWRVLGPWSFEILGGLRLLIDVLRRRPDVIYARHDLYTSAPALVARLLRIPLAAEVNSSVPEELVPSTRSVVRRIVEACERFTLRSAARVLVLAEPHGRSLASRIGIDRDRIRTVPIGARLPAEVDPARTRSELGVGEGTFLIGYAGNLAPIQGVDLLIEALRDRLPGVALWIIGTGTEEGRLRRSSSPLEGRVRLFGGVEPEEAERLLGACQLLAAPYRRAAYEQASGGGALSSKVLTYLAVDRPLLISDLDGYSWVEEIGAGTRFVSDDPISLAGEIDRWQCRWREAGAPLGCWPGPRPGPGRRFVEEGRTWDDVAGKLESVLDELLAEGEA